MKVRKEIPEEFEENIKNLYNTYNNFIILIASFVFDNVNFTIFQSMQKLLRIDRYSFPSEWNNMAVYFWVSLLSSLKYKIILKSTLIIK